MIREQPDLADVRGLTVPKRALEIALAGRHHLLMVGPPGVGKTMLARRIPGLLPDLGPDEIFEAAHVDGLCSWPAARGPRSLVRMPHHTISVAGLLGGGNPPRPGEVTLAHRGVLYLDELPEFSRSAIEGLREPLEDKKVTVVRARSTTTYPADFVLVAAATACPCGWTGHHKRVCMDSSAAVERWQARIPWGLFDMVVRVEPEAAARDEVRELVNETRACEQCGDCAVCEQLQVAYGASASPEPSTAVAARITLVRELQATREREPGYADDVPEDARFSDRCLAVARTIADLDGDDLLAMKHIDEALAMGWAP
jgi:magnesium chelatase family protein